MLEIGVKPDSKSSKDWTPRLFVLKHYTSTGRATLDYYKSTKKRWQKQSIKGVISLWPDFKLSIAHQCSYKYTLSLETPEQTVYLAAPSVVVMNRWYYFIQTQQILEPSHDMYIFNVQARDSDAMNVIGAVGDCQLVITPDYNVKLVRLPKKEVLCIWPFDTLKTFSYGGGLFSFSSGRHSPHGPGEYSFITGQDKLIHNTLQKQIDRARRGSTVSSGSSSHVSMSDRPPAKLPPNLFKHNEEAEETSSDGVTSSSDEHQAVGGALANIYTDADGSPCHPPPLPHQPPPKVPPKGVNQGKTWLHDRYNSASPERDMPPNEGGVSDHLYSHTVHPSKVVSPTEEPPPIYNALVHEGQARPLVNNYELAYPKPTAHVVQGTDSYSFISQGSSQKPVPIPSLPSDVPPTSPVGMTTNPLYGSSNNLLEAVESSMTPSPSNKPLPPPSVPVTDPLPSSDALSEPHPQEVDKSKRPARPDVTANPTYVTTSIKEAPPTSNDTVNPREYSKVSKPVPSVPPPKDGERPGSDIVPSSVGSDFIASSVGSDPPPIPEREYSFSDCENTNNN